MFAALHPRATLSLLLATALAVAGARAQEAVRSATTELRLPAGLDTLTVEWDLPLAPGQAATLDALTFDPSAADGLTAALAFAKTSFAARQPLLTLGIRLERTGGEAGDQVTEATARYSPTAANLTERTVSTPEPSESVLATGQTFKLAVADDGIYAITPALLERLGVSSDGLSPGAVRLYSKGGAMLPEVVGAPYPTDLQEVSLHEDGNGDASWGPDERLLFYGQGEDVWSWDAGEADFLRAENLYSDSTYYFLQVGGEGARVAQAGPVAAGRYDDSYTARTRWEEDETNLLYYSQRKYGAGQGSGQDWFGQSFLTTREVTDAEALDLGSAPVAGASGRLRARLAASALRPTTFTVTIDGRQLESSRIGTGQRGNANQAFAGYGTIDAPISLTSQRPPVTVAYPGSLEANPGWLDFVQVTHPAELRAGDAPLFFRSAQHTAPQAWGFALAGGAGRAVWDITDPLRPVAQALDGEGRFGYLQAAEGAPREFVAFDPGAAYPAPEVVSTRPLPATNLHGISRTDLLIVYGEGLEEAARTLQEHRQTRDGFTVELAPMSAVADEFGGGRFDPGAIRALTQMIYARDQGFRFVLLLGDASFDQRGIIDEIKPGGVPNHGNLVPAYQTAAANWEVSAFPTDDYYVMLDAGEGRGAGSTYPTGRVDVAVGRIPARTGREALDVIRKVIRYDTSIALRGDWRLRTIMVADDEDGNLHVNDMDDIAEVDEANYPEYNQVKVYADAFEQVTTLGGVRIPRAAAAINQNMFRGNLITTYLGHGGPSGWAQERILNSPDITTWNSANALPVLVTATCTFTGFDDPARVVAGEEVIFKPDGGAVASLSTVRPVYTNANRALTLLTHELMLNDSLNRRYRIGELMLQAKKATPASNKQNDLKYGLFGDPSMRLGVPRLEVALTRFDSVAIVDGGDTTAIPPLRETLLAGEVREPDGSLAGDFSGEVLITLFDQATVDQTLGQDRGSFVKRFKRQESVLFKGKATVTGGRWEARVMIPKDVSLARGAGKVSLYVRSTTTGDDGAGVFERFLVDGLAAPATDDDTPPQVEIFLGDESFEAGGVTGSDTELLLRLADDTGINVSGASIGHDLTATLRRVADGAAATVDVTGGVETGYSEKIVLNDFYEAATDDYRRGEVRYPLTELAEGTYELEVRAWDLANNPVEALTQFTVSTDADAPLRHVLNYPNPFVDATCFQFEHSAPGREVEVQVDIYTTSGRRVRSIREARFANGTRFGRDAGCIAWDGTDDFSQPLARGTYLYRVTLDTDDEATSGHSDFEKLVILR